MDEIELVVKGKVQDWRVHRNNAYLIHCSLVAMKDRAVLTDALPLPYDFEIINNSTKDLVDFYNEAVKNFPTWN